jgi:hypothetical protein
LYAAEVMPALTLSWVPNLLADDPEGASKHLPTLPPPGRPFTWRIQDSNAVAGLVDILLYQGHPDRAWAVIETYWKSLSSAIIMRVITVKTLMSVTRMRCAVGLAASERTDASMRHRLLSQAERDARTVERTRCGWACALAGAARAGILSVRGRRDEALKLLESASADLLASELVPWYQSAQWHLARRRETETGIKSPTGAWWSNQRVANPERIANLLVPGIWTDRTV